MPKITWVNHASFVVESPTIRLISDPWLSGSAFNHGWSLLSESRFKLEDLSSITHIWFSHEHPDHFVPGLLKAISPETRSRITVLFQQTEDGKVLKLCRNLGFKTQELRHGEPIKLAEDFEVTCGKSSLYDSWLAVRSGGVAVLNLNDCVITERKELEAIRDLVAPTTVLLSQFSYANWLGNPDEGQSRAEAAREKLQRLKLQCEVLNPRFVIPFASFVYFSHAENFYLNDEVNSIRRTYDFLVTQASAKALVMYPGDEWFVGSEAESMSAISKYENDWKKAITGARTNSPSVPVDRLVELSQNYVRQISTANSRWFIWLLALTGILKPVQINLRDFHKVMVFDIRWGLRPAGRPDPIDLDLHSDSLSYIFRYKWGFDTLQVNGRFTATPQGYAKALRCFSIGTLNNNGRRFAPGLFLNPFFFRRALERLLQPLRAKRSRN